MQPWRALKSVIENKRGKVPALSPMLPQKWYSTYCWMLISELLVVDRIDSSRSIWRTQQGSKKKWKDQIASEDFCLSHFKLWSGGACNWLFLEKFHKKKLQFHLDSDSRCKTASSWNFQTSNRSVIFYHLMPDNWTIFLCFSWYTYYRNLLLDTIVKRRILLWWHCGLARSRETMLFV